jgi:hypothetical protein
LQGSIGPPSGGPIFMDGRSVNRFKAASIHLAFTSLVAGVVFLVNRYVWYPDALFDQAGGRALLLLVVAVDLAIGPLITLIVFVPGKRGLAFDLATIALLQLAALSYGSWVMFESRPAFIVFVKDRFELVRANEVAKPEPNEAPVAAGLGQVPLAGPRTVGVRLPKDPEEQFRLMMSAMSGADAQNFPRYYVPYDEVRLQVVAHAEPIARLRELNPGAAGTIDHFVARAERPESQIRFLPMRAGPTVDLAVLVDASRGDILGIASLRPWTYK